MKLKNKNKNKHYNQYWKRCFGGFWDVFGFWGFFVVVFFCANEISINCLKS